MSLSRFEDLTTEQLERTYRTYVFAMFWLCRFALAHMEAGSCIVNTTVTAILDERTAQRAGQR